MSKPIHIDSSASGSRRLARSLAKIAVPLLAVAFLPALFSSCSEMWTTLNNPVDPVNCQVDMLDYWLLFYSDDSTEPGGTPTEPQPSYDPVLENLRFTSGFQVLYVGFNDGTYTFGDTTAPFIMISTKYIARESVVDGVTYTDFPILDGMTIMDSLGVEYHPWIYSTGNRMYNASDGYMYTYEISSLWADPTVDTNLIYTVNIDPTNVFANDGTPLDRAYSFQVSNATSATPDPENDAIGLLDGVSTTRSFDFSASDPYWEWSNTGGSGSIDSVTGRYNLLARFTTDSSGTGRPFLFCKRYPFEIPEGTFAVRASSSFAYQTMGAESGLYLSDSKGNPVAAIKIDSYGWAQFFGPGSSDGVLRRVHEGSIHDFDYSSTVLGIRNEGGTLYFYVNGERLASTERNGEAITNAGLFIMEGESGYEANASYDDLVIAY